MLALLKDPSLPAGLFFQDWNVLLRDPRAVSERVTVLVVAYLSVLTGEDKILPLPELLKRVGAGDPNALFPTLRSDGAETRARSEALFRMLVTLYYLAVFFELDPQYSPLRVAMVKWKVFGSSAGSEERSIFAAKLRTLLQRKLQADGSFSEQDLNFLVSDLLSASVSPGLLEPVCTSLLQILSSYHLATNAASDMLPAALHRLRTCTESVFLQVSAFTRRHFLASPFAETAHVEELISSMRQFHMWPAPFCHTATDLLLLASMETKSPGVTWRHQWERHFPALVERKSTGKELDAHIFTTPGSRVAGLVGAMRVHVPTEREVTSGLILTLMQVCGVVRLPEEADTGADGGLTVNDNPPGPSPRPSSADGSVTPRLPPTLQLEYLSLKKLRGIYQKVRSCMEQALQMSVAADAALFLAQRLDHLRRAAEKHIRKERTRLGDGHALPFPKTPEPSTLLCGIPYQFRLHTFSFDCALAGRDRQGSKWPRRNARKPLEEIVSDALAVINAPDGSSVSERLAVRILIDGNDTEFHHVLSALVSVLDAEPDAMDKLDFCFYLMPSLPPSKKEGGSLAAYLNSVDPWFSKTSSVNVQAAVSFTPRPEPSENDAQRDPVILNHQLFLSPPFALQSMLSDYIALGNYRHALNIFQCECWQKSVSQKKSDTPSKYIIPFALSATVGLVAQARTFQLFNDLPASLSVSEIVSCKAFRFVPPVLSLRMVSSTLGGVAKPEPEIEARPWQELSVGLIPSSGSQYDDPSVSSSVMEIFANAAGDPVGSTPTKRKVTTRSQYRYHAQSLEISSFGMTTFDICLDGVVYGPFERVSITPCSKLSSVNMMSYYGPK